MGKSRYLLLGFVIMCFNSLYQYSWNLLEPLFRTGFSASLVQVELGFTLFTISSTLTQPLGGYVADREGPKRVGIIASMLSALGFLGTSFSNDLSQFYVAWTLGSVGEGILYSIAANLAVKWFRERRGLATGMVTLGFGLGATLANPFLAQVSTFREATLPIGLTEVVSLPLLLYFSDYPKGMETGRTPLELLKTSDWWLIYFSYIFVNVPILVYSSSLVEIASPLPRGELVLLLSLFPLVSGVGRPILGYLSDLMGRIRTAVMVQVVIALGFSLVIRNLVFPSVIVVGLFSGSTLPIYFSLVGDLFGVKYSTSNNALLYTGKAVIGVLGGVVFAYLYSSSPSTALVYVLGCVILGTLLFLVLIAKNRMRVGKHSATSGQGKKGG